MQKENRKLTVTFAELCAIRTALKYSLRHNLFDRTFSSMGDFSPKAIAEKVTAQVDKKYASIMQKRSKESCKGCDSKHPSRIIVKEDALAHAPTCKCPKCIAGTTLA